MDADVRKELRQRESALNNIIEAISELTQALEKVKASKSDSKLHKKERLVAYAKAKQFLQESLDEASREWQAKFQDFLDGKLS